MVADALCGSRSARGPDGHRGTLSHGRARPQAPNLGRASPVPPAATLKPLRAGVAVGVAPQASGYVSLVAAVTRALVGPRSPRYVLERLVVAPTSCSLPPGSQLDPQQRGEGNEDRHRGGGDVNGHSRNLTACVRRQPRRMRAVDRAPAYSSTASVIRFVARSPRDRTVSHSSSTHAFVTFLAAWSTWL